MSLKSTIDQLTLSLEKASTGENELRTEIQTLQRSLLEVTSSSQTGAEKLKQVSVNLTDGYLPHSGNKTLIPVDTCTRDT